MSTRTNVFFGHPCGAWAARLEALAGGLYDRHAIGDGGSGCVCGCRLDCEEIWADVVERVGERVIIPKLAGHQCLLEYRVTLSENHSYEMITMNPLFGIHEIAYDE